jgi:hypothetical protein
MRANHIAFFTITIPKRKKINYYFYWSFYENIICFCLYKANHY